MNKDDWLQQQSRVNGSGDVTSAHVKGQGEEDTESSSEKKSKKSQHITFVEEEKSIHEHTTLSPRSASFSFKPPKKPGPARRRQPSFKEDSPPLYDLFAVSVCIVVL